ncbi:hypothetical protein Tco_1519861, partial [Tanacetum coccineum]
MRRKDLKAISDVVHVTLKKVVTKLVDNNTNDFMKNNLPKVVAEAIRLEREKVKADIAVMIDDAVKKERGMKINFDKPIPLIEPCKVAVVYTRDHEDHHYDDARPEEESSARRQKTSKHGMYIVGESSSSQAMDESTPSGSGTQEKLEDFDAWQDYQGIDDDEVPSEEVSLELLDEVSGKIMTTIFLVKGVTP